MPTMRTVHRGLARTWTWQHPVRMVPAAFLVKPNQSGSGMLRPFFDTDEVAAGVVVDKDTGIRAVEGAVLGVAIDWCALVGGEPELNAVAHGGREAAAGNPDWPSPIAMPYSCHSPRLFAPRCPAIRPIVLVTPANQEHPLSRSPKPSLKSCEVWMAW